MNVSDFHFDLPDELIARYPLKERSASRLLSLDGLSGVQPALVKSLDDARNLCRGRRLHSAAGAVLEADGRVGGCSREANAADSEEIASVLVEAN